MARSNSQNKSQVFTSKMVKYVPFSSEIVLENAFDEHHVARVHCDTVKSCQVIMDYGNVVVLLYELIPIRWLRFYTRKFIVLKTVSSTEGGSGRVNFVSLPVSTGMVSYLTVKANPSAANKQEATVEQIFRLRVARFLQPFAKLLIFLRDRGESRRWEQDFKLMTARDVSIKSGHIDNPHCLTRRMLLDAWFGRENL